MSDQEENNPEPDGKQTLPGLGANEGGGSGSYFLLHIIPLGNLMTPREGRSPLCCLYDGDPRQNDHGTCITVWNWNEKTDTLF